MFRCPSRKIQFLSALVVLMVLVCPLSALAAEVNGVVQSGDPPDETPIAFSTVTLFKAGRHGRGARVLGRAQSDSNGQFTIVYKPPAGSDAVLYLIADGERESSWGRRFRSRKSPVRLATVLGTAPFPDEVTINERTTVATAYAMAQFIQGRRIGGKFPGLQNAADILRNNLVDVDTGEAAAFFNTSPNTPEETSTLATFNSLANMLAACVQTPSNCMTLFQEATTPRGRTPRNTLQAMVNIAHNPGQNVPELFNLSQAQPPTYQPALPSDAISTGVVNAWILAISYNAQDMDGPGNIAFDSLGNAWVNNNYEFSLSLDPDPPVCGSTKVIKLTPTGGSVPGAPFGGMDGPNSGVNAGGLYGAGFGITLDPDENVWISSFGFQGSGCLNDLTALYVTVAKFGPDGTTLSTPDGDPANNVPGGFTNDPLMAAPQGIVSDRKGNIWIANCTGPDATLPPHPTPPGA